MTPNNTDSDASTEPTQEQVHHDRKATTAADTWDEEPMDKDTAVTLKQKLEQHGYETRLVVEAKHEDSCVIKTIDNQEDADVTLGNIHLEENYPTDNNE